METAFQTDTGKIREHNEDSGGLFYNQADQLLAVVADGVGGHRAGEVASALALNLIKENWEKITSTLSHEEAKQWLCETIVKANTHILSYAREHPECTGMGTTVVAALCAPDFTTIAHAGDSRCHLLEEDGLRQMTEDHTLVNELVRQGQISEEEAVNHPQKHVILQALGTEETIEPEAKTVEWQSGNIVLLCSDGLTDYVSDEQLEDVLRREQTLQEKADLLTELANETGGYDNITLVLVQATNQDEHSSPNQPINENTAGSRSGTDGSSAARKESR